MFSRNYGKKKDFQKSEDGERPREEEEDEEGEEGDSVRLKVRDKWVDHHEKASTHIYIVK